VSTSAPFEETTEFRDVMSISSLLFWHVAIRKSHAEAAHGHSQFYEPMS
jgi:hypothetical protein